MDNTMSVLDELREAVEGAFQAERDNPSCTPEDIIMEAINRIEAAHPGLVDHTVTCCRCGAKGAPWDPKWLYDQSVTERPIPLEKARVCPDCERYGDIRDD